MAQSEIRGRMDDYLVPSKPVLTKEEARHRIAGTLILALSATLI